MVRYCISFIFLFGFITNSVAQQKGILPLTGINYFREGIWGKSIHVTIDDNTLVSNKIPLNSNFDIKLVDPTGLFADAKGMYHPGVKILLLNSKKDTLGFMPNIFGESTKKGFDKAYLKKLTVTLGYTTSKLNVGDTILQYITFFDTKSNNKLLLEFPIVITNLPDSQLTTTRLSTASSTRGYNAAATNGINFSKVETYLDSIYFPKLLYHTIRLAALSGITLEEAKQGTYTTWLYDENMKEMLLPKESNQYIAQALKDKEDINILIQIPLQSSDAKNKKYTVRYRWESSSGDKIIDVINKF